LGVKIVAEGVETEEQRHFLRQNNCDYLQGYLYSPPIPAAEFVQRFIINKEWNNA